VDLKETFKKDLWQIAALFLLAAGGEVCSADVAIIAHPSVKSDSLDKKLLSRVYRGEVRSWQDGTKIKVCDLGERGETREQFYDYLGIRPSRLKSHWMKQLLTGEGEPPDEADSEDEMIKKVMSTPGAIGYVDKNRVDGKVKLLLLIQNEKSDKSD
jgi:ABC-type phosphate transport system substrate-binding protein